MQANEKGGTRPAVRAGRIFLSIARAPRRLFRCALPRHKVIALLGQRCNASAGSRAKDLQWPAPSWPNSSRGLVGPGVRRHNIVPARTHIPEAWIGGLDGVDVSERIVAGLPPRGWKLAGSFWADMALDRGDFRTMHLHDRRGMHLQRGHSSAIELRRWLAARTAWKWTTPALRIPGLRWRTPDLRRRIIRSARPAYEVIFSIVMSSLRGAQCRVPWRKRRRRPGRPNI